MGRVAVVTGGTRGIGAAISVALKDKGYRVAANYAGNDSAAHAFQAEHGVPVYKFDVGDYAACQKGVAQIVKDELRHATVMYGLLADLGFDVETHVRQHDENFTMRIEATADIGTQRITSDKRVNIFYYPIDTWADFVFFNFCMDRGAGHQLEDVRQCSYGPWARAIEGILTMLDPARSP